MDRCCLYIPRLVPNTCGLCVTSCSKIFIDSLGYSWTMNLVMHWFPLGTCLSLRTKWIPCPFHLTKTTRCHTNSLGYTCSGLPSFPRSSPPPVFWSLAVCKNGWRRPDESYQVISCVLTMVSFPGFPYLQCLITFSTRITSFPDSLAP